MALPAPSPATTITLHLPAHCSVCLAASVHKEWWTSMEYVWTPQHVLVSLNNTTSTHILHMYFNWPPFSFPFILLLLAGLQSVTVMKREYVLLMKRINLPSVETPLQVCVYKYFHNV